MDNPFKGITDYLISIDEKLKHLTNLQESEKAVDKIIGIDEALELLNVKSKVTIYRKVKDNSIPHMKRGKRLLFSRNALIEWLKDSSNI